MHSNGRVPLNNTTYKRAEITTQVPAVEEAAGRQSARWSIGGRQCSIFGRITTTVHMQFDAFAAQVGIARFRHDIAGCITRETQEAYSPPPCDVLCSRMRRWHCHSSCMTGEGLLRMSPGTICGKSSPTAGFRLPCHFSESGRGRAAILALSSVDSTMKCGTLSGRIKLTCDHSVGRTPKVCTYNRGVSAGTYHSQ